jgi:protein involved in polysaccharide export with SLBB domain
VNGLGHDGFPVALAIARKLPGAIGFDVDPRRVTDLRAFVDRNEETTARDLPVASLRVPDLPIRESELTDLSGAVVTVAHAASPGDEEFVGGDCAGAVKSVLPQSGRPVARCGHSDATLERRPGCWSRTRLRWPEGSAKKWTVRLTMEPGKGSRPLRRPGDGTGMGGACPALVMLLATLVAGATCGLPPASDLPPPDLKTTEVLGPGDVVEIRIFNEPDLSGVHQVGDSGQVRLPLVGAVDVAGRTPDQLLVAITDAYNARYLKNAEVSLFVKERNSQKVFVLGQVGKPGPIAIETGKMTVIEAIARAGGTTKLADASRALLTREHDGKQFRVSVNVAAIGNGTAPDVELQPGDILFVPETIF